MPATTSGAGTISKYGGAMTGIQYIVDAKGRKVAVQINLRKHKALWEDLQDCPRSPLPPE